MFQILEQCKLLIYTTLNNHKYIDLYKSICLLLNAIPLPNKTKYLYFPPEAHASYIVPQDI